MRKPVLLLLFVAAAIGLAWFANRQSPIERLFGGAENVSIVASPITVQVWRIGRLTDHSRDTANYLNYPITAGPVTLASSSAANVSKTLLAPSTYEWEMTKGCRPIYGVRLSFVRDGQQVDVLLCFECNILLVGRNGVDLHEEDFDYGRAALVRAAKEAFPDDAEIQQLPENRGGLPPRQ